MTGGGQDPERRTEPEPEAAPVPEPAIESEPGGLRESGGPIYLGRTDQPPLVSGHFPAPDHPGAIAASPEHDWLSAAALIIPLVHPVGTVGTPLAQFDKAAFAAGGTRSGTETVVDDGPLGLTVVYSLPGDGFDVIINGEHLLSWRVDPATIRAAATANLAAWSAGAPWTEESSGDRRILSSETGDGLDAARILLGDVRAHLTAELGAAGRVLVGLPDRDLLLAAALPERDPEFAALFAEFVREHHAGAYEPIDPRVFELVDGELIELITAP